MQATFNKHTALFILRQLRAGKQDARWIGSRRGIAAPDASPWKRWSKSALAHLEADVPFRIGEKPYAIAVPNARQRVRTEGIECSVYKDGVPEDAFIDLGENYAMSSPELLFIELAATMDPVEHLLLGHELCGSFTRDAESPYENPVTFNIAPVTSVSKIKRFLNSAKNLRGIDAARDSLSHLNDNAWSPTESLIAAFMRLPIDQLGFDFGELVLNPRIDLAKALPGAKTKRHPDIVIAGTPVGVNYDGLLHLNLDSIVTAAMRMGAQPGSAQLSDEVARAVHDVRSKALDDIRRTRELSSSGLQVMPVTKEDLYTPGGLDMLAMQLVSALERYTNRDMALQRLVLESKALSDVRYRTLLSFLPGKNEHNLHLYRRVGDLTLYESAPGVSECWIEL